MGVQEPRPQVKVDAGRILDLIFRIIDATLCQTIFTRVRRAERRRRWSLELLVRFWIAVILRSPRALSQALAESRERKGAILYPHVDASPQAFFQRCQDLRSDFFVEVFHAFTDRLLAETPPRYASDLAPLRRRFEAVLILDGSKLEKVAHRLKILWEERAVILPGELLGIYDLFHGLCRGLLFSPDATKSEISLAKEAVLTLPPGCLVLGDRLYGTADFFHELHEAKIFGLLRRPRTLTVRRLRPIGRGRMEGGDLRDFLVEAGTGQTAPSQRLRLIRWQKGRRVLEILTNVLDPERLSAPEALALYHARWSIERMYYDLKEVLNLNRFYPANPNAVAMQVYAAAIVYNAFRVAQAEFAKAARVEPEAVSPAKFFPRLAADCCEAAFRAAALMDQQHFQGIRLRIKHPPWLDPTVRTYDTIPTLVERRTTPRRQRRFCPSRATWKPFPHALTAGLLRRPLNSGQ